VVVELELLVDGDVLVLDDPVPPPAAGDDPQAARPRPSAASAIGTLASLKRPLVTTS
jgi:hypothetical protein